MSIFGRKSKAQIIDGGELERMVAEVYEGKLALEDRLAEAEARARQHADMMARVRAAEVLARKLRDERDAAKRQAEAAERDRDLWKANWQKAEDRETVLKARLEKQLREEKDLRLRVMDEVEANVVDKMVSSLKAEGGNWSKGRVEEFIKRFLPESMKGDDEK